MASNIVVGTYLNYRNIYFSYQFDGENLSKISNKLYFSATTNDTMLFKAIQAEYGLDDYGKQNKIIDLKLAYKYYLQSAYIDKNTVAFYRLYELHKFDKIHEFYSKEIEVSVSKKILKMNSENSNYKVPQSTREKFITQNWSGFSDPKLQKLYLVCSVAFMSPFELFNNYQLNSNTFSIGEMEIIYKNNLSLLFKDFLEVKKTPEYFKLSGLEAEYIENCLCIYLELKKKSESILFGYYDHTLAVECYKRLLDNSHVYKCIYSAGIIAFLSGFKGILFDEISDELKLISTTYFDYIRLNYSNLYLIEEAIYHTRIMNNIEKAYELAKRGALLYNKHCYSYLLNLLLYKMARSSKEDFYKQVFLRKDKLFQLTLYSILFGKFNKLSNLETLLNIINEEKDNLNLTDFNQKVSSNEIMANQINNNVNSNQIYDFEQNKNSLPNYYKQNITEIVIENNNKKRLKENKLDFLDVNFLLELNDEIILALENYIKTVDITKPIFDFSIVNHFVANSKAKQFSNNLNNYIEKYKNTISEANLADDFFDSHDNVLLNLWYSSNENNILDENPNQIVNNNDQNNNNSVSNIRNADDPDDMDTGIINLLSMFGRDEFLNSLFSSSSHINPIEQIENINPNDLSNLKKVDAERISTYNKLIEEVNTKIIPYFQNALKFSDIGYHIEIVYHFQEFLFQFNHLLKNNNLSIEIKKIRKNLKKDINIYYPLAYPLHQDKLNFYLGKAFQFGFNSNNPDKIHALKYYFRGLSLISNKSKLIMYDLQIYEMFYKMKQSSDELSKELGLDEVVRNANMKQAAKESDNMCVVCYEVKELKLYYPCMHIICCESCSSKVIEKGVCPFCRKKIVFYK